MRRLAVLFSICASVLQTAAKDLEHDIVAAVLISEAGVDGVRGMEGVGEVIATRARERRLTPVQVVRQPRQFSSLNGKSLSRLVKEAQKSPLWGEALAIASAVCDHPGSLPNRTHGANHFTVKTEHPYWAAGHQPVAIILQHAFYRL